MIVTKKKNVPPLKIYIDGIKINKTDFVKYLGVTIDNQLDWKQHVSNLCSKVAKGSWAMHRLKNYVDKSTLNTVHCSLVYSH